MLQIDDSGDALDIDLDNPFQEQMLDISQPIVADEQVLRHLKQQVHTVFGFGPPMHCLQAKIR